MSGLVQRLEPAVVMIECSDINSKGSGFLITADGHIVTNNHVVSSFKSVGGVLTSSYSSSIEVVVGGVRRKAGLIIDQNALQPVVYDYAILKVDGPSPFPFLEARDLAGVQSGEDVFCLGFPLDFTTPIVTKGIVSAITRRPSHINAIHQLTSIVSDALIHFGNSGGPMIHIGSGKVIGINTLTHPLEDQLRYRLFGVLNNPSVARIPGLKDLMEYCLRYIHVGFNHAVSMEHVRRDPSYPI